jgi:hypothetical protein
MLWQVSVAGAPGADISAYYRAAMDKFAAELAQPVTDGVRVWALYNAGFVVKSPTRTIAFDLVDDRSGLPGDVPTDFKLFKYIIPASVINQIDVLFISHEHLDHTGYGAGVAGRVKAKGGAVLFPRAGCLIGPNGACGTAPFTNATILVDSGSVGNVGDIAYVVRANRHGTVPNMGYEVTLPNGYKIVHQDSEFSRIEQVKNVDVLFENVWINGGTGVCKDAIVRDMTIVKPGLMIPTHMHEMNHDTTYVGPAGGTAGRCGSNRYNYSVAMELQDEATPSKFALLTWGEKIDYKR